jgi:hypothetical protein
MHTAKDFWSLCRVHTHGKGATWRKPVLLGAVWGVPVGAFAVRARARPHGKGEQLGTGWAHGIDRRTAKPWWRTAKNWPTAASLPHGKELAHGRDAHARQRC